MCQYANENTNLPDNDFIHKDKSFVGFVGFQADVTGFPVSQEGIFLEREVGILVGNGCRDNSPGSEVRSVFGSQQLDACRLVNTRTDQLHEAGGYFVDIGHFLHIDHTVEVVQISLPAAIQISQSATVSVDQGIHTSCHITGI